MAQADLTGFVFFLPILTFLFVFIVIFIVMHKTKIVENKWVELFTSVILATVFISAVGAREYVVNIIPWFAVLIVSLFLILAMVGFVGSDIKSFNKGIGITFVILLLIAFLLSAIFVFSPYFTPYLPGGDTTRANPQMLSILSILTSSRIMGAILLVGMASLVGWVLVKNTK